MNPDARARLVELLTEARRRGFLGPGRVEAHIDHTTRWAATLAPPESFLDLGTGGGVPGLVLALLWPDASASLLDSQARRCSWLTEAGPRLGLPDGRLMIRCGRAETLGHDPELREAFPLVLARAFALPAATAECASAFCMIGGVVTVSDPPGASAERWPEAPLARLGLRAARLTEDPPAAVLEKVTPLEARWPRRDGVPARKPLWR